MTKPLLLGLTVLLLISTLSGCLVLEETGGYRRGDSHERDRGKHHGEEHERH